MKKLLLLNLMSIMSLAICFGQDVTENDSYYCVEDTYTPIYENIGINNNGDYSRGGHIINVRLYYLIPKPGTNDVSKLYLSVSENAVKKKAFNFTKVGFVFENGERINCLRYTKKNSHPKLNSPEYIYDITKYEKSFKNLNLSRLLYSSFGDVNSVKVSDKYVFRRQYETITSVLQK